MVARKVFPMAAVHTAAVLMVEDGPVEGALRLVAVLMEAEVVAAVTAAEVEVAGVAGAAATAAAMADDDSPARSRFL